MDKNNTNEDSALRVNKGVDQPSDINADALQRLRSARQPILSIQDYIKGIRKGDRAILSRAITLIESARREHQHKAQEIIQQCLPYSGNSIRIGITGVPGVGKSTFIEALGIFLTKKKYHIAVLAIDPSSARSKGSILGDKTRMELLANDPQAYIRPSPTAGSLGGVARKTRESIILCEAAGFDVILVETVGVGQSEIAVHAMVDYFLLLMLAGAGDELQGIKRGIMEMADGIVINKADRDNIAAASRAQAEYSNALHLFPAPESGWIPEVLCCSAMNGTGIEEVWSLISEYKAKMLLSGYFDKKRKEQDKGILYESVNALLNEQFFKHKEVQKLLPQLESDIARNQTSAYIAAQKLVDTYLGSDKDQQHD